MVGRVAQRTMAIVLLLPVVAACGTAVPSAPPGSPSAGPTDVRAPASISPSPSFEPSASPVPSLPPSPTPDPASPSSSPTASPAPVVTDPSWTQLGRIGIRRTELNAVLGFAGGYLAVGTHSQQGAVYWFSDDGREWQRGVLSETTADCSGDPSYDAYVSGAASDGHRLIVTGQKLSFDSAACGDPDAGVGSGMISWTSIDGQSWTPSEEFGHRHAIFGDAWITPDGGFEGLASSWDLRTALWQSGDGIEWQQAASFPEIHGWSAAAAISDKGIRLLASRTADDRLVLLQSTDGRDWTPLAAAPDIPVYAEIISLLHVRHSDEWLVITVGEPTGSVIYSSSDLSSWSRAPFPQPRFIRSIAVGPSGYVVSAERQDRYDIACDGIGCPGPSERQYLSRDGLQWTQVAPRISEGVLFAEGPAGLIAVGLYGGDVWLLEP